MFHTKAVPLHRNFKTFIVMKKSIYYIGLIAAILCLQGCPIEIPPVDNSGEENGHEYIDMGTSVMWSPVNLGATVIGEYGDYYAWGELEPKEKYNWDNYKWCRGEKTQLTKYYEGDNRTILELEDDAAHVHWGGTWRTPSQKEWKELISVCTIELVHSNYGEGFLFTAKNGNTLFFPLAGLIDHVIPGVGTSIGWRGRYRINAISHSDWTKARHIDFSKEQGFCNLQDKGRYEGCSVRPVCEPTE
jgi:hypothetical protein